MKKVNNAGTVNHTAQKDTGCSSILSKKSMPSGNKKSKRLKEKEIENINIPCFRAIEGTAFIVTTPSRNIGILREASNINKVNLPDVEIVYIYNGSEIIFYFGFKNENNNVTDGQAKIYNDNVLLYEIGCCYGELLYILNKRGDSPTRYPESCPIKSFTDVFMKAASIGIPEKLHRRLGQLFAHIDIDDWSESYDKLLSMEKRMFFVWGRCGIKIDHLEKEYQDRCSNNTDAR